MEPKVLSRLVKENPQQAQLVFDRLPLKEEVELLLRVPTAIKHRLITLSTNAKQIVPMFPVEEFFLMVKELVAEETLELINLSSDEQLHYLLDLDLWRREELDIDSTYNWLSLLARCDLTRLLRWLNTVDFDLLMLMFKQFFWVVKPDERLEELSSLPEGITLDNFYFINFKLENDFSFLINILDILRERQPQWYYTLMEGLCWEIDAELEEQVLFWRQSRLAARGIPPREEAVRIYQYLTPEEFPRLPPKERLVNEDELAPWYPLTQINADSFLAVVLAQFPQEEFQHQLKLELVSLSNKVIVADALSSDLPESLLVAVKKVNGYINIAVELLAQGEIARGITLLQRHWLLHLFQLGYSQVMNLHQRATRLVKNSPPQFLLWLDSPLAEVMHGLLKLPTHFFRGSVVDGALGYVDYGSLAQIEKSNELLDEISAWQQLVTNQILPPLPSYWQEIHEFSLSSLLVTAWAQLTLHGVFEAKPLSSKEGADFLKLILTPNGQQPTTNKVKEEVKTEFSNWWQQKLWRQHPTLTVDFLPLLNRCFRHIEEEFCLWQPQTILDAKFVKTLWIV